VLLANASKNTFIVFSILTNHATSSWITPRFALVHKYSTKLDIKSIKHCAFGLQNSEYWTDSTRQNSTTQGRTSQDKCL